MPSVKINYSILCRLSQPGKGFKSYARPATESSVFAPCRLDFTSRRSWIEFDELANKTRLAYGLTAEWSVVLMLPRPRPRAFFLTTTLPRCVLMSEHICAADERGFYLL